MTECAEFTKKSVYVILKYTYYISKLFEVNILYKLKVIYVEKL